MRNVVVITGGSRGIGAATALLAARRGYDVCISYRTEAARADLVLACIAETGRRAIAVQGDVADEKDVIALFQAVDRRLGTVTALVNNAGVVGGGTLVQDIDATALMRVLAVNVAGSFLCAREAVRRMSTRYGGRGGAIVNVSSAAARHGSPGEFVHYAASKGAIDTFTVGLAKEVADQGIRVNAVRPGMIDTEIHATSGFPDRLERIAPTVPMKRVGTAEEVAEAILWLISEQASYVTAAHVDVAGGR